MFIRLKHNLNHDIDKPKYELSDDVKENIFELCESGMSPFQIFGSQNTKRDCNDVSPGCI